jgi:hypothetical protein
LVIRHGASPELSLFRGKLIASHDIRIGRQVRMGIAHLARSSQR